MKPYIVTYYPKNLYDFGFKESTRGVLYAYAERTPRCADSPEMMNEVHPVYFTDDEDSASMLVQELTRKQPGTRWLVAKTTHFVESKIIDHKTTIKSVTDKGMLP